MLQQEQQASAEAAAAAQAAAEELRSQLAEAESSREAALAEAAAAAEAEAAQLRAQLEQAQALQQSLGGEQAALQAQLEALTASHQQVRVWASAGLQWQGSRSRPSFGPELAPWVAASLRR